MTKICTTIEQCKKLLDLGIDINTADLTVTNYPLKDGSRFDFICCKLPNDTFPSITDGKSEKIPAWSLSALLDLMPANLPLYPEATEEGVKEGKYRSSDLIASTEGYLRKRYDGLYQYRYDRIKTVGDYDNPIDAAFEMVVWLKENGKI